MQILPFRYAFLLNQEGIRIFLENGWLSGLSRESYEALLRLHIEQEHKINPLCFYTRIRPEAGWAHGLPLLAPLQAQYQYRIRHGLYDHHFTGQEYSYPVSHEQLGELAFTFACFFPIYDAYLQIAKNAPPRLDSLIEKLNSYLQNAAKAF